MPRVTETIANLTKKITDHLEQKADKEEKYPSLLVVEEFDVRMLGRIKDRTAIGADVNRTFTRRRNLRFGSFVLVRGHDLN